MLGSVQLGGPTWAIVPTGKPLVIWQPFLKELEERLKEALHFESLFLPDARFKCEWLCPGSRLSPRVSLFEANELDAKDYFCDALVQCCDGSLLSIQFIAEEEDKEDPE